MVELWIAVHRRRPVCTIFSASLSRDEAYKDLKAHKEFDESKYEKRGPTHISGSLETWWSKAKNLDYPDFEVLRISAENDNSLKEKIPHLFN